MSWDIDILPAHTLIRFDDRQRFFHQRIHVLAYRAAIRGDMLRKEGREALIVGNRLHQGITGLRSAFQRVGKYL